MSYPYAALPAPGSGLPSSGPAVPVVRFRFDGGALTWLGVGIGGALITMLTLGICYPWAVVMTYRWKTKHTILNGYRLQFTGSAWALFGQWLKWFLLTIITIGIYSFWVYPRLQQWIVEHQTIDPSVPPQPAG